MVESSPHPEPHPVLHLYASPDLSSLTFCIDDREVGRVEHPRLLWECSCHPFEGGRSPERGPCAVHRLPQADGIGALFGCDTRIHYRGLTVRWNAMAGWPPSIDSLFFAMTLLEAGWPGRRIEHLWDAGAGTGFLGMQIAHADSSIRSVTAIEVLPAAADLCRQNYETLPPRCGRTTEVLCERAETTLAEQLAASHAVAANPPYLPLPPPWAGEGANRPSPATGTDMLRAVIRLARSTKACLALEYSSLAQADVDEALAEADDFEVDVLAERQVPLRLAQSSRYAQWLESDRGLIRDESDVFEYQHTIRVIDIRE